MHVQCDLSIYFAAFDCPQTLRGRSQSSSKKEFEVYPLKTEPFGLIKADVIIYSFKKIATTESKKSIC